MWGLGMSRTCSEELRRVDRPQAWICVVSAWWPSDARTSATGGGGSRRRVALELSGSDARSTAAVPNMCEEALARRCESAVSARAVSMRVCTSGLSSAPSVAASTTSGFRPAAELRRHSRPTRASSGPGGGGTWTLFSYLDRRVKRSLNCENSSR